MAAPRPPNRSHLPRVPGPVEGWTAVGVVLAALAWSAISPRDWPHWIAAAVWVVGGLGATISLLVLARWRDRQLPVAQPLPR